MPDLWPDDLGIISAKPPKAILAEQGEALSRKTQYAVRGEVVTVRAQGNIFMHRFDLVAPALNDYRYSLFRFSHGIGLYPVTVTDCEALEGGEGTYASEAEFVEGVRYIFGAQTTLKVVSSLIIQSR